MGQFNGVVDQNPENVWINTADGLLGFGLFPTFGILKTTNLSRVLYAIIRTLHVPPTEQRIGTAYDANVKKTVRYLTMKCSIFVRLALDQVFLCAVYKH
jgi:hypothetical protein